MSFSFSSLIRLIVFLVVGTTMLAVGLSRLDPPRPSRRSPGSTRYYNINEYFLGVADRATRWLDAETGEVSEFPLAKGEVLDSASSSPWVDEQGRRQVVGRWSNRTEGGPMSMSLDFGLARYRFPSGERLDEVSTEIFPVSPPCWFPGTRARVMFAAGDGSLYHYAFEAEGRAGAAPSPGTGRDLRPTPVSWRCKKPGQGDVFLGDLTWPDDPKLAGRVVVTLREQEILPEGVKSFTRTQLWWLRLNGPGTEIVEAGRLLVPDVSGADSIHMDERSPSVATLPDGQLALAYLHQRAGDLNWELRLAPIAIQADRHAPMALESSSRVLATGCQPVHPTFSADGRWINAFIDEKPPRGRIARLSTAPCPSDSTSLASRP